MYKLQSKNDMVKHGYTTPGMGLGIIRVIGDTLYHLKPEPPNKYI